MGLITGLGLAAGSLIGGILGMHSQSSANSTNLQATRETNATNMQIAAGTNAMNAALQQQQWNRDDTAYQRSVADMQAAGLNPLSGVNPQSSPLSASMQGATMQAGHVDPLDFGFFNDFSNLLLASKQLEQNDKRIALDAISRGVDPEKINDSSANQSVIADARNALSALASLRDNQAAEAAKNAHSPYVRGEGAISQGLKDIAEIPKTGVKILDGIISAGKKIDNVKIPQPSKSNNNEAPSSDYRHHNPHYKNNTEVPIDENSRSLINVFRRRIRGR